MYKKKAQSFDFSMSKKSKTIKYTFVAFILVLKAKY